MIKQLTFIPVKKALCSQTFVTLKLVVAYMYLTHLSIITLVLVIPGASEKNPDLVKCPIPDLFRTIFVTLVRIRTKFGIPDLSGPTVYLIEKGNSNGPLNHGKKAKQCIM